MFLLNKKLIKWFSEALTNLSYMAGTTQTCYKLLQEASGHTVAKEQFGQSMWKRFQETTCFQKVIEDIELAFLKVIGSSLVSFLCITYT